MSHACSACSIEASPTPQPQVIQGKGKTRPLLCDSIERYTVGGILVVKPWAQSGDLLYGIVATLRYGAVFQYQGRQPIQLTGSWSFLRQREERGLTGSGCLAWMEKHWS